MRYLRFLVVFFVLAPHLIEAQSASGRIYVRRIEFQGATRINDEVLRREMLQLEGAFLNTVALEQSRLRLERLPYVATARVGLRPLDEGSDQVDIVLRITEEPARRYGGGGAYSESLKASLNGYFLNENIFGTGERFSAQVDGSEFRTITEFSHTDPHARPSGVSRTVTLTSRRIDQLTADTSDLEADLVTALLEYGYQTGESHAVRLGIAVREVDLTTGALVGDQLVDWVRRNGNPGMDGNAFATDFSVVEFLLRWGQDTRNRTIFPDRGVEQNLTFRAAAPGGEVEYFTLDYELTKYWPLSGEWSARFGAKLGYGARFGSDTTSMPPYLNWFAGGPDSVRGYRENRLGPRDNFGKPYGGNLFVAGQFEVMMPLPEKWRARTRIGFFYDFGNVFSTEDVRFEDNTNRVLDYGFEFDRLRQSVGVAAQILIPIGLLRLSYGVPLNAEDDNPNPFLRDELKELQISVGVDF